MIMSEVFSIANLAVLSYGFLVGLRHATDADHLAAVGTIVAERRNLLNSILIGGLWGLGHTVSLSIAGFLILFFGFEISEESEKFFEFCVGIILLLLGLNVFRKLLKGGELSFREHYHGMLKHSHPYVETVGSAQHGIELTPRSFLIGLVHGLAGSAGLMLMVIPMIDSKFLGILYILVFGIGSVAGMMLMSFLVSLPFFFSANIIRLNRALQALAGGFSLFLGIYIIYETYLV